MRLSQVFGAHFAAPLVCPPTTGGPLRKVLGFALIGLAIAGAAYGDEHEFTITLRNTALITYYNQRGETWDSGFQELEIPSGRVLFQWSALAHVPLAESYSQARGSQAFDYFHINSVALGPDGNYLISGRNTHALYDINRRTGAIRWRQGGKRRYFAAAPGTTFNWQHYARHHSRNTIPSNDR